MKKPKTSKKKLKRIYAKKYLSLASLALVVTFAVACGKQDSSSSGGAESASASMAAAEAVAKAEPSEPVPTLPEWCDQSGGFMHNEHLCEVQMKKMYGRNMMVVLDDWWQSDVQVKANDTIQVVVAGKPRMMIGGEEISSAVTRSYVAKSDGTVSFQSRSMRAKFEVREITAKRCYNEKWQLQVCPKS